jgi:hypothetical protein
LIGDRDLDEMSIQSKTIALLRASFLPIAACVLIVLLLAIWPADAPWGGDDVSLITAATRANSQHRLVDAGLGGSFGFPYGPIPSQIYQMLVLLSHDPVVLIRLHAVLFAGFTAFTLLYLSRVLKVSPWFAPLTMLGPFFWFYTRLMWDNTFAIPVGALLLASYGDYLRRPSRAAFFTFVSCGIALPLIHPMTLPLAVAVAAHALASQRAAIRRHWVGLIVIGLITTISCGAYVERVVIQIVHSPGLTQWANDRLSRGEALVFPLLSGRLFTARGFFDSRGPEVGLESSGIASGARAISALAYPLFWLGLARALIYIRRPSSILSICVVALLLQSLMDCYLRITPYPHYYCGTWAVIVVLIWTGLDWLARIRLRTLVGLVYAGSLCISTVAFAIDIHRHAGGRVWYGPSIGSQMLAAAEVSGYSNPMVRMDVAGQSDSSAGIMALIHPSQSNGPAGKTLIIRYTDSDPVDCHLRVVDVGR